MPNIEELLSAICERSAQAVTSQAGIDSEPLRRHLQATLGRPAGDPGSFLADPLFEGAFGWLTADRTMAELSGTLLDPALVAAMDEEKPIGGRAEVAMTSFGTLPSRATENCTATRPRSRPRRELSGMTAYQFRRTALSNCNR